MGLSKALQEQITGGFLPVAADSSRYACKLCGNSLVWHIGRLGKHLAVQCEQFRLQSPALAAQIYHSLPTSIPLSKADRKLGDSLPLPHGRQPRQAHTANGAELAVQGTQDRRPSSRRAIHEPMLKGKWALVTGAGRGIGRAIAILLASEGCSMALTSRSVEELDEVARECERAGSPATYVAPCDLSDGAAVERLAQDLVSTFGGVEVLVNNAGILVNGNPLEGDPNEWEHMMDVIVNAPMRLTRRLAPKMAERMSGFVINIGSIAGTEAMSGAAAAYAAAKAGLRGWSRSAYLTLRHKNVKCVLINPGFVNTDMVTSRPALVGQLIPERMIQPSDIADAVSFVLNSSPGCVPEEMNLRLGLSAFK